MLNVTLKIKQHTSKNNLRKIAENAQNFKGIYIEDLFISFDFDSGI